jgi:hypothetical protein
MSQVYTDDSFAAGHVGQTDLQAMENNFAALKSMFSGASAPSNAVAGMPWFDTAQKVKKTRNNANDAWFGLFHGDVWTKILVYDDSPLEGYVRDSGVTDKVVALKGGSVYTTAATTAGDFTYTGFTKDAHVHGMNSHTHSLADYGSVLTSKKAYSTHQMGYISGGSASLLIWEGVGSTSVQQVSKTTGTPSSANTEAQSNNGITSDGNDRPAAAVCILVYLDL